ncbi:hypothetical protein Tsubulata_049912 [Turnera subulata]|uniref:Peptidase A1 domain-containing protein n=1 Tax=Turnera subulata TaxID=218843 RepID=A0A9Q0F184_9ROSI|nr:hypothetical protein Tsubulata_049912 [Turnera subulata]
MASSFVSLAVMFIVVSFHMIEVDAPKKNTSSLPSPSPSRSHLSIKFSIHHVSTLSAQNNIKPQQRFKRRPNHSSFQSIYARGEYLVRLKLGYDSDLTAHFLLDTGSSLIWWQCAPCIVCFNQTDDLYDSEDTTISSYEPVGCDMCSIPSALYLKPKCTGGKCIFTYGYMDESKVQGVVGQEYVSDEDGGFQEYLTFGCANNNIGKFGGTYSGILGFGRNNDWSFPGQVQATRFSYCFNSKLDRESTLYIESIPSFVDAHVGFDVPLIRNSQFYYVDFEGFSIDGVPVPINNHTWKRDEDGGYGVVLDTGTPITRLEQKAYIIFRDRFVKAVPNTKYHPVDGYDTCYRMLGWGLKYFPRVTLRFGKNKELDLTLAQMIIEPRQNVYCLAILPERRRTILGSRLMRGTRFTYDVARETVRVVPQAC